MLRVDLDLTALADVIAGNLGSCLARKSGEHIHSLIPFHKLAGLMTKYDDVFYEPNLTDHGLPRNPFKSCVVPRPIGWISTLSTTGVANLAPYSSHIITLNELGTRNSKM